MIDFKLYYEDMPRPKAEQSRWQANLTDKLTELIIKPLFAYAWVNRKRPDLRNLTFRLTQYTKYSAKQLFVNTSKWSRGKAYAGYQATIKYLAQTLINR